MIDHPTRHSVTAVTVPVSIARRGPREAVRVLEARLTDGYQRIDEAVIRGENVDHWEAFWIELLHEYEALCDARVQAA